MTIENATEEAEDLVAVQVAVLLVVPPEMVEVEQDCSHRAPILEPLIGAGSGHPLDRRVEVPPVVQACQRIVDRCVDGQRVLLDVTEGLPELDRDEGKALELDDVEGT